VVVLQGESVSRQASGHTQDSCAPGLSFAPFRCLGSNSHSWFLLSTAIAGLFFVAALSAPQANAQQRREREPNIIYAERRAQLAAQADGPIILWGFTGREEVSQANVFAQEENFYYLTGHSEEGAGLIIFPAPKHDNVSPAPAGSPAAAGSSTATRDDVSSPREMLFLPAKDPAKEKWNGVRMSPTDPDITARTGFATVKPFAEMRAEVEKLAKNFPAVYTILPYEKELGGYPHERQVVDWLQVAAPQAKVKDIRQNIYALREIKSPGEIAFLQKAV
jgi:Xaa-Pro aminopeptidase